MFFQLCVTDPNNEDDIMEATCIELDRIETKTRARLGLSPVQPKPNVPWFLRYWLILLVLPKILTSAWS